MIAATRLQLETIQEEKAQSSLNIQNALNNKIDELQITINTLRDQLELQASNQEQDIQKVKFNLNQENLQLQQK